MKITRITVQRRDLPPEHPYWLSGGRLKYETFDATFVRLDTDAGRTGWGEGTPWGHTYVPAHGPGIRAGLETMAAFVLGLDPRKVLEVERAMDHSLPGHLSAASPIDMACWDIAGPAAGLPITAPVSVDECLVTLQDTARTARDGLAEVFVMATGGSVLADAEALHLAATVPDHNLPGVWACQDMRTAEIAGGRGPRNTDGFPHLPDTPGLGVHPDEDAPGDPVAVYGR